MLPNFAQPIDNRTDADIPLSFVSLLRWCEERNIAPEPLPDSDEAKRLRSEFIAHVERLGGIADAATFQSEGWADEPYRSVRGRAKQLCRRLAVGHGEVPRACLDPQPCHWPLKPLKTDRDLLSWLYERLEQLDSGIEAGQLKHRCVAMIEAMRIAHGWLEQRRIFNAPRCAVTEVELNEVFTNKFNGLGWSNSLPPHTVVEALVRDLVNQIRQSFLDLLSWLQDRVGTEMEPDSDSKTVTPPTGQDPTRIPTRRQLDGMHGAALVCLNNFHVARLDISTLVAGAYQSDGQPVSLKRLEETLPNLTGALTQFDERWTADVADWFCLHHPDYQARFGEQLTATRYARDCCANAVIAVKMALKDIAGGLNRAREFLWAERCAITEANIDDEWRHACRELPAVTGNARPTKPVVKPTAGDDAGGGQGEADAPPRDTEQLTVPALSEKQYLILETMKELGAMSADTRRKADDIATACDGKQADVNVFKPLLSDLTKRGLTRSKTGSGGGSWLMPQGIDVVKRLLDNRQASASKR